MPTTAFLFMTHKWSPGIASAARSWRGACKSRGIDFVLLFQGAEPPRPLFPPPPTAPDEFVFAPTSEVAKLYPLGFVNLWTSSHWILMWWWLRNGRKHDLVFRVEYDVRILGDASRFFDFAPEADVVLTSEPVVPDSDYWFHHCTVPGWCEDRAKLRQCWWQVARFSSVFLDYLHGRFVTGENAQDEIAIATHATRGGFAVTSLSDHLCEGFNWDPQASTAVTVAWLKALLCSQLAGIFWSEEMQQQQQRQLAFVLFHPVKM